MLRRAEPDSPSLGTCRSEYPCCRSTRTVSHCTRGGPTCAAATQPTQVSMQPDTSCNICARSTHGSSRGLTSVHRAQTAFGTAQLRTKLRTWPPRTASGPNTTLKPSRARDSKGEAVRGKDLGGRTGRRATEEGRWPRTARRHSPSWSRSPAWSQTASHGSLPTGPCRT